MNSPGPDAAECGTHGHMSDELRTALEQLANRLQPWLERLAGAGNPAAAASCTWCPICALIAALRGDRPEAFARLAQHGAGLIAAVRELLASPAEQAPPGQEHAGRDEARSEPVAPRTVQHIVVRPAAPGSGGAAGC